MSSSRWAPAAVVAGAAAVVAGAVLAVGLPAGQAAPVRSVARHAPAAAEPSSPFPEGAAGTAPVPGPVGTSVYDVAGALPPSPPVRLRIRSIGVDSTLLRLGLTAAGELQVPASYSRAGWFTGGPAPGSTGPAVLGGHVDSHTGPAVFFRLRELRPGSAVSVTRADGRVLRFVVTDVRQYPKDRFPSDAVYGAVPYPALRLITCGGSFNALTGHYRDNVVVSARLAGS